MTGEQRWKLDLEKTIAIFESLTPDEQHWLGMICINLDDGVPHAIAKSLIKRKLICKLISGYDVSSYWIHYCWCVWCARKEMTDASDRPKQDQEGPQGDSLGSGKPKRSD